jgi:hypothetical protein
MRLAARLLTVSFFVLLGGSRLLGRVRGRCAVLAIFGWSDPGHCEGVHRWNEVEIRIRHLSIAQFHRETEKALACID